MKNKIQFVLCLLSSFLFVFSGANKIFHFVPNPPDLPEKMAKMSAAMMEISWLMPLIAVVEIGAGILFIFKKTRALAAIMLFPILIGIFLTHLIASPKELPLVIVLFAINIWVIIDNRQKYLPMIG